MLLEQSESVTKSNQDQNVKLQTRGGKLPRSSWDPHQGLKRDCLWLQVLSAACTCAGGGAIKSSKSFMTSSIWSPFMTIASLCVEERLLSAASSHYYIHILVYRPSRALKVHDFINLVNLFFLCGNINIWLCGEMCT